MRQERATHCLQCVVLAAFKRPRFKRVGMKRAKKTKIEVKQTEQLTMEQIATTGGGQAPAPATLLHHTSVAAATTARDDKLQGQLEERQECVWRAKMYHDLSNKEVFKIEKQHELNVKIFEARLVRWEREERSKKPPRLSLVRKREDKNIAFLRESEQKVSAVREVAMEARVELAEAICHAHLARIAILKRRVRQLSKCQKSQPSARKARAGK